MTLLDQTCRVAIAAIAHDMGVLAERAGASAPGSQSADSASCSIAPAKLAVDAIARSLPSIKGAEQKPFGSCTGEDSLLRAASGNAPETLLQSILAASMAIASGASDISGPEGQMQGGSGLLKTLFEQVRINSESPEVPRHSYELSPLTAGSAFPIPGSDDHEVASEAQAYRQLWDGLLQDMERIPKMHARSLPLWLDHFDTLWMIRAQSVPCTSSGDCDVPLYDHSKTAAALACALWRWHTETNACGEAEAAALKERTDWNQPKLLFIQGDFHAIQNFIFSSGSNTNRQAAKILRGRSFCVSLISELAALKVLKALDLPSTSQITNAAGKFLIVAPNTRQTAERLAAVRQEIAEWFVKETLGSCNLSIVSSPCCCADLASGQFSALMKKVFDELERVKLHPFDLCSPQAPVVLQTDYSHGVCSWNERMPADGIKLDGEESCRLTRDQVRIGELLTKSARLLVFSDHESVPAGRGALELPVFGFRLFFTAEENVTGKFGEFAENGLLQRCWDFSMPETEDEPLWHGYARRYINGYIPRYSMADEGRRCYEGTDLDRLDYGDIKTFGHLACEDRVETAGNAMAGIRALGVLKGDIDNLGLIFQKGLAGSDGTAMNFARMAGLSRQINAFFTLYLPCLCAERYPQIYTVYAGGDDFFFIGPWLSIQKFAGEINARFRDYVSDNPSVHFSAGIATLKPGIPVRTLSQFAETALESAKSHDEGSKNAVCVFGETVSWKVWGELNRVQQSIESARDRYGLSTGYLYGFFDLIKQAKKESAEPEASIWRSRFYYRTARWLDETMRGSPESQQQARLDLIEALYKPLETFKGQFIVPLSNVFYSIRQ